MKNKFIILTLCFTIFFTNINLNNCKSYANNYEPLVVDGGIISAPVVATVVTLAVGTGLVLNSDSDIETLAYNFYSKYKDNWEDINSVFNSCVSIGANKLVTVGKEFKDLVLDFLDSEYGVEKEIMGNLENTSNGGYSFTYGKYEDYFPLGQNKTQYKYINTGIRATAHYNNKTYTGRLLLLVGQFYSSTYDVIYYQYGLKVGDYEHKMHHFTDNQKLSFTLDSNGLYYVDGTSLRLDMGYTSTINGVYSPGSLKEKDDVGIYVPGSLDSLVGYGGSVVDSPTYDLPSGGVVTLPGFAGGDLTLDDSVVFPGASVDDPSIPGNPSIPNEGVWENIKDFIISLVVPSDSFWTDTFNGFRDNLNKNFPMLDMSGFDSLLINGKPFPNIYAYGSKIVDGDIINSIVDWLRPIIAGFIMICLMFFNYRKVYKLIRNSEPFGNIAPGTSDFTTGLSSQDIKQIVADAKRETERRTYRR